MAVEPLILDCLDYLSKNKINWAVLLFKTFQVEILILYLGILFNINFIFVIKREHKRINPMFSKFTVINKYDKIYFYHF